MPSICSISPFLVLSARAWRRREIRSSSSSSSEKSSTGRSQKLCLRCNSLFDEEENSPTACSFHGHITGEKGLFALAPPHQGIDGEWTDGSGVIVYKWNDKMNRPNTGSANWKKRWSCCSEHDELAPACRRGRHVSYDDGFTLFELLPLVKSLHRLIHTGNLSITSANKKKRISSLRSW